MSMSMKMSKACRSPLQEQHADLYVLTESWGFEPSQA